MKKLLIVFGVFFLSGCADTPNIVKDFQRVKVIPIYKVSPDLGGNYVAEMGDALITFETGSYVAESTHKAVLLEGLSYNSYKHPGLKSGSKVRLSKSTEGDKVACFDEARYRGELIVLCLYDLNNDGYFNYGRFDNRDLEDIYLKYKLISLDKLEGSSEYVKQKIIFRGFSSGRMLFSYAEFKGRMDKATYVEDFKVDYEKTKHIMVGYKGARLKVKKANNVSITYQLIANFN